MSPLDHAEDLAKKLAGNHRRFESFGWSDRPEDDQNWAIVYTHNRDSNARARSNAHVIAKALEPFPETDVRAESHSHWACGWVDGFAIRVRDEKGDLTPAFLAYAELATALKDYPVLDEDHFSELEMDDANRTWANCYNNSQRIEYIRNHRSQFEFRSFADMVGCVRGKYFAGDASELLY